MLYINKRAEMKSLKPQGKREAFTYVIILLWVIMGSLGVLNSISLNDLAIYFLSLTGFAGSYLFGESYRTSNASGIFSKGANSRREIMIYLCVLLWFAVGLFAICANLDFIEVSTYFAALTPFVGGAILGETFKKDLTSNYSEIGIDVNKNKKSVKSEDDLISDEEVGDINIS